MKDLKEQKIETGQKKHFNLKTMKELTNKELSQIYGGRPWYKRVWDFIGELAGELTEPHDWRTVNGVGLGSNWREKMKEN